MKVILDTCVLKLATLPNLHNPSALIVELCELGLIDCWASPAILDEYSFVLADQAELLGFIQDRFHSCFPLKHLDAIKHEPDNRFLECALAVQADYLITVNTARGHFDRASYGPVRVATPGAFVNLPPIHQMIQQRWQ